MAPAMQYTPQSQVQNDKSALTIGRHPALLIEISDEETPPTWKMFESSPRMWRWHFVVWAQPEDVGQVQPEYQTAITSQKFSPEIKARNGNVLQASKAYEWTSQLLGHKPAPGEPVDLDPLMPLACMLKIDRKEEYANIKDVERWPQGDAHLTPAFLDTLADFLRAREEGTQAVKATQAPVPSAQPVPPPTPQPAPATGPAPGMQTWQDRQKKWANSAPRI